MFMLKRKKGKKKPNQKRQHFSETAKNNTDTADGF